MRWGFSCILFQTLRNTLLETTKNILSLIARGLFRSMNILRSKRTEAARSRLMPFTEVNILK